MAKTKTMFKHDCPGCTYLGPYEEVEGAVLKFDLYFCPQGNIPTVIARHGDDGPDYMSGLNLSGNMHSTHPLVEAARRARLLGLIKEA